MKKFLALVCMLSLAASMTVCAADSPTSKKEEPEIKDAVVAAPVVIVPSVPEMEQEAAALGKSIVEYVSNSVTYTPGLPDAAVIAQGGGAVINGAASNATFTLNAVESGTTAYALSQAKALGGTALNVVDISAPGINFTNAEVGFYVAGVKAGDKVAVYQSVKGDWVAVDVAEVSNNTVKIKMNTAGIYCFIKL